MGKKQAKMINAKNLRRVFVEGNSETIALNQVDLNVQEGDLFVVKGSRGAGKTALISILAGLDRPSAGELTVKGMDLISADEDLLDQYRRTIIGIVSPDYELFPAMSLIENICLPGFFAGTDRIKVNSNAEELLDWLELYDRKGVLSEQLNIAEKQRALVARALVNNPDLLLLDEPSYMLSQKDEEKYLKFVVELNQKLRRTVVIATQSDLLDPFASMIVYLHKGSIEQEPCEI
jgi:ABC-type lipoprotein export system ATPase subunit